MRAIETYITRADHDAGLCVALSIAGLGPCPYCDEQTESTELDQELAYMFRAELHHLKERYDDR